MDAAASRRPQSFWFPARHPATIVDVLSSARSSWALQIAFDFPKSLPRLAVVQQEDGTGLVFVAPQNSTAALTLLVLPFWNLVWVTLLMARTERFSPTTWRAGTTDPRWRR